MIRPIVIHIHAAPPGWQTNPDYVYIGRAVPRQGLKESRFANPYKVGKDGTAAECVAKFRADLKELIEDRSLYRELVKGLAYKFLVCWCKKKGDEPCHGDPIADACEELNREDA